MRPLRTASVLAVALASLMASLTAAPSSGAAEGDAVVSGTIVDRTTGEPLAGATVWVGDESAHTDAQGRYRVEVWPDPYLTYTACVGATGYEYWCWDDQPSRSAKRMTLTAGGVVEGIDIAVSPISHLRGRVMFESRPLAGVTVTAYDGPWISFRKTTTDADGAYDLEVGAGTYRIGFSHEVTEESYWGGALTYDAAASVDVGRDATVSGLDAVLERSTGFGGRVTLADGRPLPMMQMSVYRRVGADWQEYVSGISTGSDGRWRLWGIEPGTYRVMFGPWGMRDLYAYEWWPDASSFADAADVVVAKGEQVDGIDAVVTEWAHLRGRLVVPDGVDVGGAGVSLIKNEGGRWYTPEQVAVDVRADGTFDIPGVKPGTYSVCFDLGTREGCWGRSCDRPVRTVDVVGTQSVTGLRIDPFATAPVRTVSRPRLTGKALVGRTMVVTGGQFRPTTARTRYRWLVDGRVLPKQQGRRLEVTRAMRGHRVSVGVQASSPGCDPVSTTAARTAVVR